VRIRYDAGRGWTPDGTQRGCSTSTSRGNGTDGDVSGADDNGNADGTLGSLRRVGNFYGSCYTPWNMQARALTCARDAPVSSTAPFPSSALQPSPPPLFPRAQPVTQQALQVKSMEPGLGALASQLAAAGRCRGGASHRAASWAEAEPNAEQAVAAVEKDGPLAWVGVVELFEESMCVFHFKFVGPEGGTLPPGCACERTARLPGDGDDCEDDFDVDCDGGSAEDGVSNGASGVPGAGIFDDTHVRKSYPEEVHAKKAHAVNGYRWGLGLLGGELQAKRTHASGASVSGPQRWHSARSGGSGGSGGDGGTTSGGGAPRLTAELARKVDAMTAVDTQVKAWAH